MSEFLFQKALKDTNRQFIEELDNVVDLRHDPTGQIRPGSQRGPDMERQRLQELKALIERVQAGEEELSTLLTRLTALTSALQQGIQQCQEVIEAHEEHREYFEANIAAYQRGIEGLGLMAAAVQGDDAETLWQGMAAFESSVQDIDTLVNRDK